MAGLASSRLKIHSKTYWQTRSCVPGIYHCSHWLQKPSSWAQTPFHVPHFLIIGNKLYSWPFLSSKHQDQTAAKGKEGMWRQGRTVKRNSSAALRQGLSSAEGIYLTGSLSCFADTETPTRWEKLTACCPPAHRPQTSWKQKIGDADFHLLHHQPIRRMSRS